MSAFITSQTVVLKLKLPLVEEIGPVLYTIVCERKLSNHNLDKSFSSYKEGQISEHEATEGDLFQNNLI